MLRAGATALKTRTSIRILIRDSVAARKIFSVLSCRVTAELRTISALGPPDLRESMSRMRPIRRGAARPCPSVWS